MSAVGSPAMPGASRWLAARLAPAVASPMEASVAASAYLVLRIGFLLVRECGRPFAAADQELGVRARDRRERRCREARRSSPSYMPVRGSRAAGCGVVCGLQRERALPPGAGSDRIQRDGRRVHSKL